MSTFKVEEDVKEFLLEELSHMDPSIVSLAYLQATNLVKYGVDITSTLKTATEQSEALRRAYMKGRSDIGLYDDFSIRVDDEVTCTYLEGTYIVTYVDKAYVNAIKLSSGIMIEDKIDCFNKTGRRCPLSIILKSLSALTDDNYVIDEFTMRRKNNETCEH